MYSYIVIIRNFHFDYSQFLFKYVHVVRILVGRIFFTFDITDINTFEIYYFMPLPSIQLQYLEHVTSDVGHVLKCY